ncbi:MAG: DMT family transporter [Bacteriovorax sp.]|nr:DMT family transporter [Bacteriovorax sp.]
MSDQLALINPLYYALSATLCFSYASIIFAEFARKVSPFWMNTFKAFVALAAFIITIICFNIWMTPTASTVGALLLSGCLGLMIGDIFMLKAMATLGASRMLMIFGLQPFFLGIGGYFFFHQHFSLYNLLGLVFMTLCLFTISLEYFKKSGTWQLDGLIAGLIAILFDGVGIFLTRFGFEDSKGISAIEVNAIRCVGAIIGFILIYFLKEKITFKPIWKSFTRDEKIRIVIGSLLGTFVSLILYLTAISRGKLSIVSAVTVTGPMFASVFESVRYKKWPSSYTVIAFIFFLTGFFIFYKIS